MYLHREVGLLTTITARELNHDVSAAKRQALEGPVVITDRGKPAFVLLSIEDYRRLDGGEESLVERLGMDDDLDIEFAPVEFGAKVPTL